MSVAEFAVGAAAVVRLTRLFAADSITAPIRDRLTWAWSQELVECPWCLSVWVAAAVLAAWVWLPTWLWVPGCVLLAWSLVAGFAHLVIERLES